MITTTLGRGKGLHPSTPHRVAHRLGAEQHPLIGAALAATPRGQADLTWALPAIPFSQGGSSTCFAHAFSEFTYGALKIGGKPLSWVPSPLLIASITYESVRARNTPAGQPLPVLVDTGAELQDVADACARYGVGPIGPDVAGRYSDVPDDQDGVAFPEADAAKLQVAGSELVSGEYAIAINGDAPLLVAAALDANIFVWDGFFCDSTVENLEAGQIAGVPNESDSNGGGHATGYCAYKTLTADTRTVDGALLKAGEFVFKKRNSWSASFADAGDYWVSSDHVRAAWSLWPFTAKVSP